MCGGRNRSRPASAVASVRQARSSQTRCPPRPESTSPHRPAGPVLRAGPTPRVFSPPAACPMVRSQRTLFRLLPGLHRCASPGRVFGCQAVRSCRPYRAQNPSGQMAPGLSRRRAMCVVRAADALAPARSWSPFARQVRRFFARVVCASAPCVPFAG